MKATAKAAQQSAAPISQGAPASAPPDAAPSPLIAAPMLGPRIAAAATAIRKSPTRCGAENRWPSANQPNKDTQSGIIPGTIAAISATEACLSPAAANSAKGAPHPNSANSTPQETPFGFSPTRSQNGANNSAGAPKRRMTMSSGVNANPYPSATEPRVATIQPAQIDTAVDAAR